MKARVRNTEFIASRVEVVASGCWNWTGSVNAGGRGTYNGQYAYRLAYEILVGPLNGLQVNHHCDNPLCVNPEHLYAGTQAENMADAARRGRARSSREPKGESAYNAYPDAVIDEIRDRYRAGEMQKDLAAEFCISIGMVRQWVSGGARGRVPIRRSTAPCGTRAGYSAHQKRGEKFCGPCFQANSDYMRAYKAARKLRSAA